MPQFGQAACASGACDIVRVIVVDICSCVVVTRQGAMRLADSVRDCVCE